MQLLVLFVRKVRVFQQTHSAPVTLARSLVVSRLKVASRLVHELIDGLEAESEGRTTSLLVSHLQVLLRIARLHDRNQLDNGEDLGVLRNSWWYSYSK